MGAYSSLHDEVYRQIKGNFPEFTIRENIRPDWLMSSKLTKLELDLYIEEINTAIEVQGMQHYEFIPHFHKTYAGFEDQKRRDQEKRDLCYGRKVKLVEIAAWIDLHIFINELLEFYRPTDKQEPTRPPSMLKRSALENDEFREEIKVKRAAKKAAWMAARIAKREENIRLLGTRHQRTRARKLYANLMMDGRWVVWGGDSTHIMQQDGEKMYCNCRHAKEDKDNLCCHVIKIQMATGTFRERKKAKVPEDRSKPTSGVFC